jgi:hypothetical protein
MNIFRDRGAALPFRPPVAFSRKAGIRVWPGSMIPLVRRAWALVLAERQLAKCRPEGRRYISHRDRDIALRRQNI